MERTTEPHLCFPSVPRAPWRVAGRGLERITTPISICGGGAGHVNIYYLRVVGPQGGRDEKVLNRSDIDSN